VSSSDPVPVLTLRDISHVRGGREVLAVDRLEIWSGQRLAVLGPNGAGKTTLLRLLAGVDTPTHGYLRYGGRPYLDLGRVEQAARRRSTAYLSQRPALLNATVVRNVELPLGWRGVPRPDRRPRALEALNRLGVAHLADRRAHTLSGGEAQRVALARALVTDPDVLLLDEPAAALDVASRDGFLADLAAVLTDDRSLCVIHVSHRADEALRFADLVAVLVEGRLRQLDTPATVLRAPADPTVARLLGYPNVLPVIVDGDGTVRTGSAPLVTLPDATPGPATLAVWAHGIRLTGQTADPSWTVTAVRPGAGSWQVTLHSVGEAESLLAHVPLGDQPPRVGDQVPLSLRAVDVALIPPDQIQATR
jgi:ABC-type sulfate/molybdate transport systems ATPase subunit